MAPIYESDIAEKRWSETEWNNYELWEKVEVRLRRIRRLWISGAVLVFLLISSIPIVQEQRPKWMALAASRALADEVNRLKRDASIEHLPHRIRFAEDGSLRFIVEKMETCSSEVPLSVRTGELVSEPRLSRLKILNPETGAKAGVPGVLTAFCYDPISGSEPAKAGTGISGFAIIPGDDLSNNRFDRLSVLLLSGPSSEISFD